MLELRFHASGCCLGFSKYFAKASFGYATFRERHVRFFSRGGKGSYARMKFLILFFTVLRLEAMLLAAAGANRYYELQEEPRVGENFSYASVQCWLPADGQDVRGVLCVALHPHGENCVQFQRPEPWVALARRNHCALIGISFVAVAGDDDPWCHAGHGSGRALLAAIEEMAKMSDSAGMKSAPLVVAGICEAGQFAYEFASFCPKRTSAFFTMGGAKHVLELAEGASRTRALLIAATDRGDEALSNMRGLFERGKVFAAPWSLEREPIAVYDAGHCSNVGGRFLARELEFLGGQDGIAAGGGDGKDITSDSTLSFVSTPLASLGTVSVSSLNLGSVRISSDSSVASSCDFDVIATPECGVDEVQVSPLPGVNCKIRRTALNVWRVTCELHSGEFPSGPFHVDLAIRFYKTGGLLLGGLSERITGRFIGDIRVEPAAAVVAQGGEKGSKCTLSLKSTTNQPFEILDVETGSPGWIRSKVIEQKESSAKIECAFNPPAGIAGQAFSGYLTIRVNSREEKLIKVLYYGVAPK